MALARLMRLVKRYKLGLRELNYADELRVPTLGLPAEVRIHLRHTRWRVSAG